MIDESYNGETSFNWEVIINAHVQLIISRHSWVRASRTGFSVS